MRALEDLTRILEQLDGRGYKAYKTIAGSYDAGSFVLHVDHVQGDPYAEPSRVRATLGAAQAELPKWTRLTDGRCVSTADYLSRCLRRALGEASASRGSGTSGVLYALPPGQQVLRRTSMTVTAGGTVEARFRAGLPASGRRILGRHAAALLTDAVPRAVERSLRFSAIDAAALRRHLETVEDAQALRAALDSAGLVAFIADGAILPRRSGVDDRPRETSARPLKAPPGLAAELTAPNAGVVAGMGIQRGVTLIVGGGYHGKSTLLRAIERGIYDHVPGDGREQVVASQRAVKVRAEDGRHVAGADISNFIDDLPDGQATRRFGTPNASGSTSQAAAITEALEVGADCLLLDEDTCATNFMIRDARMQKLVASEYEPITPLIDRVRLLYDDHGVSTVVVVGGAGDYFDVANTVIAMRSYEPADVTAEATAIRTALPALRTPEAGAWRPLRKRVPRTDSFDPRRGRRDRSIKTWSEDRILYGEQEVDLAGVEQIVEMAQTRAMAHALAWAHAHVADGQRDVVALLARIMQEIEAHGLDAVQPQRTGDLAEFRVFELAAFVNRLRSLKVD